MMFGVKSVLCSRFAPLLIREVMFPGCGVVILGFSGMSVISGLWCGFDVCEVPKIVVYIRVKLRFKFFLRV